MLELFKASLKVETTYPTNVIGHIIILSIFYWLHLVFFDVLASLSTDLKVEINWIYLFLISYALISLLTEFLTSSVNDFFRIVTLGTADPLLVKPYPILWLIAFRSCKPSYIVVSCIAATIIIINAPDVCSTNQSHWLLWLSVIITGIVTNIAFATMIHSLSLVTQREMPVDYIHSELNAFSIVPTSFYPSSIATTLTLLLPMLVAASAAAAAAYSGFSIGTLFYLISATITCAISYYCLMALFRRYDSIGG